jgi:hypothetical protein
MNDQGKMFRAGLTDSSKDLVQRLNRKHTIYNVKAVNLDQIDENSFEKSESE